MLVIFSTSAFAVEDSDKYKLYKFTYKEKDDCGCFIEPDICGGGFYLRSVENRILYAWNPPSKTDDKTARVQFRIHKNGRVSDIKLISKSDSPYAQSALHAVRDAAPFYSLPDGAPQNVDIKFSFPTEQKTLTRLKGFDPPELPKYKLVPYTLRKRPQLNYLESALGPYLMNLDDIIWRKWKQSDKNGPKLTVGFTMNSEGKLFDFTAAHDENPATKVIYDTIKQSSPVDLPPGLPGELKVKFTFDPTLRKPYLSEAQLIKH